MCRFKEAGLIVKAQKSISIKLLGKEFQVACPDGQEDTLFKTAEYLNSQMQGISNNSKIVSVDKIAIMAALNITTELLVLKAAHDEMAISLNQKLIELNNKLNDGLKTKINS